MEAIVLAILNNVVAFMEKNGATREVVMFDIDESLVHEIYESTGHQYSVEQLQVAADKCIAHEWLKHKAIGQKYGCMGITEKGIGIVRSIRAQELAKKKRKPLKQLSDFVEDHKGLMVALGFFVALAGLFVKFIGG
ncbi:MAG: hypothetical protein ACYDEV_04195 [Acidiferrobacter sp.]